MRGEPGVKGVVHFSQVGETVKVHAEFEGLRPGKQDFMCTNLETQQMAVHLPVLTLTPTAKTMVLLMQLSGMLGILVTSLLVPMVRQRLTLRTG
uniref:Super oxide dismutase n=1 Tax=Hydatigena taeniaeformis TaxID=6205 RepID=D5MRW8_HYDTA|nr:super oxide dismutase [Hydatigera taeniaeformis]